MAVEVRNLGIGGERTDQALARLERDVLSLRPRLVTVMYGTNDSYVDPGARESRITVDEYRANLTRIVKLLRAQAVRPVLMTSPRWADDAAPNGLGENPNPRLEPYVRACREVARKQGVPLVDHFEGWSRAVRSGVNLREWTTDGCHPNPRGHEVLTKAAVPAVLKALDRREETALDFEVRLETPLKHDDGKFLWYHPRVAAIPRAGRDGKPAVLMTLQKHLHTSDHYSGLHTMRSDDLGRTWSAPEGPPELDWRDGGPGVSIAVADVTPGWHPRSRKVLAVGAQVRYSTKGQQLEDQSRAHQTAYAVWDPKTEKWTSWRRLEMPPDAKFDFARSACAQWLAQPDGTVLLPFYIGRNAREPWSVTVVQCAFDGRELKYLRHGDEIALPVDRGLVEPSLARMGDRYFLTIRNDRKGYVTRGTDGLHWEPIRSWTFDDGADLGSYNTQAHWLSHRRGLFLVYTRRGANNDHIIRHRAPLFIGRVDPERLCVIRATERVLIPERGGEYGNFGAAAINDREAWVTAGEGVWSDDARKRGAEGALFVARVLWSEPDR
jgi:lysophospholipase L1-like esterase